MTDPEQLTSWVERARQGDTEAFGHIVRRFQDMAVGYAASILGDFQLAEDAAQEAFLEAWRDLPQLREPAAFPGWLRRIVFKHCDRLTRGKRVATVPLDTVLDLTAPHADPAEVVEKHEMQATVRRAIQSLPKGERVVTILFYISEYSQQEIAAFVDLSVIAVKKRLAAARKRLKERMLTLMEESLRAQRPSRDDTFARRVLAFSERFADMLYAGTSLIRCLTELAERQDDEQFRHALAQINEDIQKGLPLSWVMARYPEFFDEQYVNAVRYGEVTGTLEEQMRRLGAGEEIPLDDTVDTSPLTEEHPRVVRLADGWIEDAIKRGASEIRLVPDRRGFQFSFVGNGVSEGPFPAPDSLRGPIFARYKRIANMGDSGEQQGCTQFRSSDGNEYGLVVSVRPTDAGEAITISISGKPGDVRSGQ